MNVVAYYVEDSYVICVEDVVSDYSYRVMLAVPAADWKPIKSTRDLIITSRYESYTDLSGPGRFVSAYNVHLCGGIAEEHRQFLVQQLYNCGIPMSARIDALYLIYEMYGSYISTHETVEIKANIRVETYHIVDIGDEMDRALELSAEELLGPTPASKAAVDALEKVVIGSNADIGEMNCRVCLEEFVVGYEATKMPCSHVFHGDCIVKWLENRFVCPLCRFELPPEEESTPEDGEVSESAPEDGEVSELAPEDLGFVGFI